MKQGEARALIRKTVKTIGNGRSSAVAFAEIPEDEAIDAFLALERVGDAAFVGADDTLLAFLFETFRRFTVSSYPGQNLNARAIAPRIFKALVTAARSDNPKVADLRLGTLQWRIANQFGFKPEGGWPRESSEVIAAEIRELVQRTNLTAEQRQILDVASQIFGEDNEIVRSVIAFKLPHPLVRRLTHLRLSHGGLKASVSIHPTSQAPHVVTGIGSPVAIQAVGGGAWPAGTADIKIVANGVVDWTASVEGYSATDGPTPGRSLAVPLVAADLLRAALTALARVAPDELDGRWLPTASDVRAFNLSVGIAALPNAFHEEYSEPAGSRTTILDAPEITLELGEVESPSSWIAARTYASGALRSARYFDAVIWANVSVEAYIDERLDAIADSADVDADQLRRATSLYADAEAILVAQKPELAGVIIWPQIEKAPSRFRQIKAAAQSAPLLGTAKEISAAYRKVSAPRNAAIHGRTVDSVTPSEAEQAVECLDHFIKLFSDRPTEDRG